MHKILIVEDESITATSIKQLLEKHGYEIAGIVDSGQDALAFINSSPPDVIIMDILLSGDLDGIETSIHIQKNHTIPIIFQSAYNDAETMQRISSLSNAGFVAKPSKYTELIVLIENALNKKYPHGDLLKKTGSRKFNFPDSLNDSSAIEKDAKLFRAIFENSLDTMVLIDDYQCIIDVNESACSLIGYTKEELKGGMQISNLTGPGQYKKLKESWANVVTCGKQQEEIQILKKNGQLLFVNYNATANIIPGIHLVVVRDMSGCLDNEKQLQKIILEKEVLLKELHHRVKNNFQIIWSLFSLHAKKINGSTNSDIFKEIGSRIHSMSIAHEMLYQSDDLTRIHAKMYIHRLITDLSQMYNTQNLYINYIINTSEDYLTMDQAIPCALIITELISNSYKHAFKNKNEGMITIDFIQDTLDTYTLSVSDNGIGFPGNYNDEKNKSLGLDLTKALVEQLLGTISFNSDINGTRITIQFPCE